MWQIRMILFLIWIEDVKKMFTNPYRSGSRKNIYGFASESDQKRIKYQENV